MSAAACEQSDQLAAYAAGALSAGDKAAVEAHLMTCATCRDELQALRGVSTAFAPPASLQLRLAERIAAERGAEVVPPPKAQWSEPDWAEVAPGISVKILSKDAERNLVSMMVRLAPGASYPAHTHAAVEELHLLDGELWIDDRKLFPGDFNRAEPGTGDQRVWSETGCTCVLTTSANDVLR